MFIVYCLLIVDCCLLFVNVGINSFTKVVVCFVNLMNGVSINLKVRHDVNVIRNAVVLTSMINVFSV